jgi:DNA (cytosine-5)-methyltransferase 1
MILRDLRNSRNLSIKSLAESLQINEKRIKLIERGLDKPTKEEASMLKDFFEIDEYSVIESEEGTVIIGEGYVTAKNNNFKVYTPLVQKEENRLKVLDLFCGIGGLSYGFEQTGNFSTIGGLDLLEDRIKTFQLNHKPASTPTASLLRLGTMLSLTGQMCQSCIR